MKRSSQIGGDLKTNLKNVILQKHVYFLNWRLSPTIMHMGLHCNEATRIKELLPTILTYFFRQIRGALKLAMKHISICWSLTGAFTHGVSVVPGAHTFVV